MKRTFLVAAWIAVCGLVCIGALELALRAGLARISFHMWGLTYQLHPQTLFGIRPGSREDIGPYGNRLSGRPLPSKPRHRVVLLGDSFAFGVNVAPTQTLSAALERCLGPEAEVINLGVAGYGPDQSLAQLRTLAPRLKPTAVVLALFPGNDFQDLRKNRLYDVSAGSALERVNRNSLVAQAPSLWCGLLTDLVMSGWTRRPSRYRDLYRSFFYDTLDVDLMRDPGSDAARHKYRLMRAVLDALRDRAREAGASFTVAVIPSIESLVKTENLQVRGIAPGRYAANEEAAEQLCHEAGIPCISLRTAFAGTGTSAAVFFDLKEHHLSPAGYAAAAEAVAATLKEQSSP
jgi:lysophospholipase L1-like esterase